VQHVVLASSFDSSFHLFPGAIENHSGFSFDKNLVEVPWSCRAENVVEGFNVLGEK
jgi:hypothetical protein